MPVWEKQHGSWERARDIAGGPKIVRKSGSPKKNTRNREHTYHTIRPTAVDELEDVNVEDDLVDVVYNIADPTVTHAQSTVIQPTVTDRRLINVTVRYQFSFELHFYPKPNHTVIVPILDGLGRCDRFVKVVNSRKKGEPSNLRCVRCHNIRRISLDNGISKHPSDRLWPYEVFGSEPNTYRFFIDPHDNHSEECRAIKPKLGEFVVNYVFNGALHEFSKNPENQGDAFESYRQAVLRVPQVVAERVSSFIGSLPNFKIFSFPPHWRRTGARRCRRGRRLGNRMTM